MLPSGSTTYTSRGPQIESAPMEGAPARPHFADYYRQIYARGMTGEQPSIPVAVDELEAVAREAMEPRAAAYVFAGAGSGGTMAANRDALRRWRIVPRMLRDVSERDLSTTVCGTELPAPLLLAPIGVQKIVHPEGELATAKGTAVVGVPMIASTASAYTIEEIAAANGDGRRWYQLYWPRDDELAQSFVSRAEAAGYSALVLTVDTFIPGWKPLDLQQAWLPFLQGMGNANYFQDPVFRSRLEKPPEEDLGAALGHYLDIYDNPALSWGDLERLRGWTSLPILIKGIQRADDARRALEHGAEGVIVSNHGGRQLDGALGSLEALPSVVEAVGDRIAVLFDSGIRNGADAYKALALGARAVCLGRPYIWGLALEGEQGVETVLRMLLAELDLTLALSGYRSPSELDRDALGRA
jgi:lactate 2-monooxygenase